MIALADGFVYNHEKIVVIEFKKGNEIFTNQNVFYGSIEEALKFGLKFKEE
jgi:hypothetical protein